MSIKGQPEPSVNNGIGRKVEARKGPAGEMWLPVDGKPHLRRSSLTGRLRTYIPSNEVANPPYGWPNWQPPVIAEEAPVIDEDNT